MLLQEPIEWGHVGFGVQARARPGRPGAVHFRRQPGIRWVHPSCTQPGLEYTSGHPSITLTDHLCLTVREPTHTCATGTFSQAVKGMLVDVDFVRGGQCAASASYHAPLGHNPFHRVGNCPFATLWAPSRRSLIACCLSRVPVRYPWWVARASLQAPLHGDDGRRIRRRSERNACGPVLGLDQCARKGREDPDKHRGSAPSCVDDAVAAPAARLRDRRLLLRRSRRLVRRYGTEHMTHAPSRQTCIAAARACQSASMAARRAT